MEKALSVPTMFRASVVVFAVAALGLFIWQLSATLFLFFGALIWASSLISVATWLSSRTPVSQKGGVFITALLALLLVLVLGLWMFPTVADQVDKMQPQIKKGVEDLKGIANQYPLIKKAYHTLGTGSKSEDSISGLWMFVSGTFGLVGSVLIIFVTGLYLALRPSLYLEGVVRLFPIRFRDELRTLGGELQSVLAHWAVGRLASMAVVGLLTMIGLTILGVELAVALGFIAGLLSVIPNFGPVLSVIPAVLVVLPEGANQVLWVLGVYAVVQALESYLITPLIQERAVSVPPALLLFTQITLGVLVGMWGLLLASPAIAASIVVIRRLYLSRIEPDTCADSGNQTN